MFDDQASDEELTVRLTYFKKNGKFYDAAEFRAYANWSLYGIWNLVRKLREEGKLPGLVDGAGREFMILVNVPGHRHEHPHLII